MEDALRDYLTFTLKSMTSGLNPCSNGRCSASAQLLNARDMLDAVLILVLMEDALREYCGKAVKQLTAKS